MKKIFKVMGITTLFVTVSTIIGVSYFTGISVFNGTMQMEDNKSTSIERSKAYFKSFDFDLERFQSSYEIQTFQIKSTLDGHMIPIDHISSDGDKNADTVIMVHGLGGNRWSNYPMAAIFLENGYNVVVYDQRSAGENTAPYTTYGYLESKDLADCVAYVKEHTQDHKLGIWGISFGGATTGIYLGCDEANQAIDFAILDSPLSNMSDLISAKMAEMEIGIPVDFMMFMGNMVTKIKLGFSYKETDVLNYIGKTKVPVMIINSKVDTLTPYQMGEDIFQEVPHNNRKIFTVEDSKHAEIFFDYPKEYESNILGFIKSVDKVKH